MRLHRAITLVAVCAVGLIAVASAAGSTNPVLQDCLAHRTGLKGRYTVKQLRHALQTIPFESQEYTTCPDVINRALLAALRVQRNGGGGSGSFLPVPVLIVLAVLVVAAAGFGAQALSNRRRGEGEHGS